MNDHPAVRNLRTLICGLPLAVIGCQHSQVATTTASDMHRGDSFSQESRQTGHEVAQASREAGHGVAEASRSAGHGVAEASRQTYAAASHGVRESGSSIVDITTNSAAKVRNSPPESLSAPVIDVDEAMQARDWDQVPAVYASGATVAGPIGFLYEPRSGQSQWRYSVIEVPIFLVNTALLPYAFAKTPPWAPVEWKAATVQPTYTGVPPLPPEATP